MSTGSTTARIAEWVAQTHFEDLPRRVTEEAKNQILSVIAAVHAVVHKNLKPKEALEMFNTLKTNS